MNAWGGPSVRIRLMQAMYEETRAAARRMRTFITETVCRLGKIRIECGREVGLERCGARRCLLFEEADLGLPLDHSALLRQHDFVFPPTEAWDERERHL